jgi:hypothetical protein
VELQPKLSVLLNVEREEQGVRQFLIQQRLKSPYRGLYGRISGKIRHGEPFAQAAQRVLREETGLTATFSFRSMYRKCDYSDDGLLEDKVFMVMQTKQTTGIVREDYRGGRNMWMSQAAFAQLDPGECFESARLFMQAPDTIAPYAEETYHYEKDQY